MKICDNIIPLGAYEYTGHSFSKPPSDLRQNMRSSGHEYSSSWRVLEDLT